VRRHVTQNVGPCGVPAMYANQCAVRTLKTLISGVGKFVPRKDPYAAHLRPVIKTFIAKLLRLFNLKLNLSLICPGPSPTCGLGLLLHKPKAQARTGLVLGLSPQPPQATKSGQARRSLSPQYKARVRPEPAFYRPDPARPCNLPWSWISQ
jgi:hypothetical protein